MRPRFPSQPKGGVMPGTEKGCPELVRHTVAFVNAKPWMNGELVAPAVPAGTTEGRSFEALISRRVSKPLMTGKGLPEDTSQSGATVKLLKKLLRKPCPGE